MVPGLGRLWPGSPLLSRVLSACTQIPYFQSAWLVSGILRLQVRDLSTRGQYATPEAASSARVGQVPTPPGLQLTASAAEPFEQQTRRCEP